MSAINMARVIARVTPGALDSVVGVTRSNMPAIALRDSSMDIV
ncbi:MAG: hypothetical protein VX184_00405 [Candidatus Thermoplasmatota archaeon]|nr:hypothetical protein [Candidatus Thermoplasmatota archaeon]